jgi:Permeases of the drug/metabolite transporter (DMT) superfamily
MLLGYILALAAEMTFTTADFFVKLLDSIPPSEISFFRSVQFMVFSYILLKSQKIPCVTDNKEKNFLLAIVGLLGSLGLLCTYYGVQYLPMSEWMVIQQTSPIIISIMAVIMLGEKFEKIQLLTIITSMTGILLIAKPPFLFPDQEDKGDILQHLLGVVFSFLGAFIGCIVQILIKKLGKQSTVLIIFYFGLMGTIVFPVTMAIQGFQPISSPTIMIGIFLVGLLTFLAQALKNKAFLYGTAARISMMGYSSIIFSFLIDIFYFKYYPDTFSLAGSGLIILGIVIVIMQNFKKQQIKVLDPENLVREAAKDVKEIDSASSISTNYSDTLSPYIPITNNDNLTTPLMPNDIL